MKVQVVIAVLALCISGCNIQKAHEKVARNEAQQAGLVAVPKPQLDASFTLPNTNFGLYKKLIINDLDLSNVKITRSATPSYNQTPWELNDDDKTYFQKKYRESADNYLFKSGELSAATAPASDTLVLKVKIIDIAPLGSKDDFKGRPTRVDVYTQGFGRMTAVFELYDSTTNKLLASATDEQELGYLWEKNDRVQTNIRIKLAFEYWMRSLNDEISGWRKA